MTSNRPYLIRALFDWIVDNNLTPHVIVDAEHDLSAVPRQYVNDGRIVLNISPSAVVNLNLANDFISFNARFGGQPTDVSFATSAVLGVYARENGQGMLFADESEPTDPDPDGTEPDTKSGAEARKPRLKVVK